MKHESNADRNYTTLFLFSQILKNTCTLIKNINDFLFWRP